jgi:tetratricopeptide (TPR) repeat protein
MKTRSFRLSKLNRLVVLLQLGILASLLHALAASARMSAQAPPPSNQQLTICGTVHDAADNLVSGALVRIWQDGSSQIQQIVTDRSGSFSIPEPTGVRYTVIAQGAGKHSAPAAVSSKTNPQRVNLVLDQPGGLPQSSAVTPSVSGDAMDLLDKPDFTVAGVTDWTAVGGHGSDSVLRTSEDLTRETLVLKNGSAEKAAPPGTLSGATESQLLDQVAKSPTSFEANHRLGAFYFNAGQYRQAIPMLQSAYQIDPANRDNEYEMAVAMKECGHLQPARDHVQHLLLNHETAATLRLAGELDEQLHDPVAAVNEFEKAVQSEPNEQNYFEWGSELLYHRAVWQALDVFKKGYQAYPTSQRMVTALAAALFAGARYDEAAHRLCEASDLEPADTEPYIFMGEIEVAAPNPLPCVEQKLARFVAEYPANSNANYLYAMALLKRQPADEMTLQKVKDLLTKAVSLDAQCADGYLQLGVLAASQRDFPKAIELYQKAILANPQLSDAHYRLGTAYDRVGEHAQAAKEFQLHEETKKLEAEAVDRQRREVKQFVVVPGPPL